jgi:hypothetical protein
MITRSWPVAGCDEEAPPHPVGRRGGTPAVSARRSDPRRARALDAPAAPSTEDGPYAANDRLRGIERIARIGATGLVANLQYAGGDGYAPITEIREAGDSLYFGSTTEDGIGRLPLGSVIAQ